MDAVQDRCQFEMRLYDELCARHPELRYSMQHHGITPSAFTSSAYEVWEDSLMSEEEAEKVAINSLRRDLEGRLRPLHRRLTPPRRRGIL